MKRRRLSVYTVVGWLMAAMMLAFVIFLWLSASASPVDATYAFLTAFRRHDAAAVAQYTAVPESSPPAEKQWRELFAKELKTFDIHYKSTPEEVALEPDGNHAMIRITVWTLIGMTWQETEQQFPLVKINGKWKVETARMSHANIPKLPL